MSLSSQYFILGLLLLASFFFHIPSLRFRQVLLAACNAGFLATHLQGLGNWLVFSLFVLSGYALAVLVRGLGSATARSRVIGAYVAILLLAFCYLKKYQFLVVILPWSAFANVFTIVGISYILFRQIHFIVDAGEGQIERPTLWEYLNYQCNLFALIAGPIQRFQDFRTSWSTLAPIATSWDDVVRIYTRLMWGIIKVCLIAELIRRSVDVQTTKYLTITQPEDIASFAVLFYGYPLYIFINFSGYCDIAIAGASLVGLRLPENFNRPYLARNMIDLWTRWHMTLSLWIRDYLFLPMYKTCVERLTSKPQHIAYFCYFIAFFLAGIWHGSTWNFAIFGALSGMGVAAAKAWEELLIARLGRQGFRRYLRNPLIHAVAVIVTIHYFCFTLLFFPADLGARWELLHDFFFCACGDLPAIAIARFP